MSYSGEIGGLREKWDMGFRVCVVRKRVVVAPPWWVVETGGLCSGSIWSARLMIMRIGSCLDKRTERRIGVCRVVSSTEGNCIQSCMKDKNDFINLCATVRVQ
ncbi:hypothetical protein Droror1_Dr00023198 [Drosera rotundifolia]